MFRWMVKKSFLLDCKTSSWMFRWWGGHLGCSPPEYPSKCQEVNQMFRWTVKKRFHNFTWLHTSLTFFRGELNSQFLTFQKRMSSLIKVVTPSFTKLGAEELLHNCLLYLKRYVHGPGYTKGQGWMGESDSYIRSLVLNMLIK